MLSKTHDAFRSASGVSDEQARAAAEESAALDSRPLRVDIKLNVPIVPWRVDTGRCRLGTSQAVRLRPTVCGVRRSGCRTRSSQPSLPLRSWRALPRPRWRRPPTPSSSAITSSPWIRSGPPSRRWRSATASSPRRGRATRSWRGAGRRRVSSSSATAPCSPASSTPTAISSGSGGGSTPCRCTRRRWATSPTSTASWARSGRGSPSGTFRPARRCSAAATTTRCSPSAATRRATTSTVPRPATASC